MDTTLVTAVSIHQRKQLNPQTDEFTQKLINLPKLHQIINYSPLTISPNSYVTDAINLMNQQLNHPVAVNDFIRQANDYVFSRRGKAITRNFYDSGCIESNCLKY